MRQFADDKPPKGKEQPKPEAPPKDPPAPPAPEKTEAKAPTAEELAARAEEIMAGMFPDPRAKPPEENKPEPKPEEPPASPTPKADEKPPEKPAEPPAPKKDKPLPPPIAEAVTPEQLKPPPAPPAPKAPEADDLDDEEQELLAAFARMEKEGKAPAGLADRTKKFWDKETGYIAQWEREHPGERFDAQAVEHAEFYEKNEPTYDEREMKRAKRANIEARDDERVEKKVAAKMEAEQFARAMREQEPKTRAAVHDAMKQMVAEAGFEDLMKKDGQLVLTKEIEAEIDKASPNARAILLEEAEVLSLQVAEIDKLGAFDGKYEINLNHASKTKSGQYLLTHRMLTEFYAEIENELASMAPQEAMRDGKRFVTSQQLNSEIERIKQSQATPEQKMAAFNRFSDHYYTLSLDDVKAALIAKHSNLAKAKIARFGGITNPPARRETPKPNPETPAPFDPPPSVSSRPPSVSSASDNVDTSRKGSAPSGKTADDVVNSMWG